MVHSIFQPPLSLYGGQGTRMVVNRGIFFGYRLDPVLTLIVLGQPTDSRSSFIPQATPIPVAPDVFVGAIYGDPSLHSFGDVHFIQSHIRCLILDRLSNIYLLPAPDQCGCCSCCDSAAFGPLGVWLNPFAALSHEAGPVVKGSPLSGPLPHLQSETMVVLFAVD